MNKKWFTTVFVIALLSVVSAAPPGASTTTTAAVAVQHKTIKIDGLDVFYREAGPSGAPVVLLLHGFPTSSHMFRNLIPALADTFHVLAPDYPGFGNSSMPTVDEFDYTFDNLAVVIEKFTRQVGLSQYTLYLQDYGAPIGFRLAAKDPQRVQALVIQNGNAYEEGLREFWKPFKAYWSDRSEPNAAALRQFLELDATKWQYTHGVRRLEAISPDNWLIDQRGLDRHGNKEIQLQLFYDYRSNLLRYAEWQAYLRRHQPPTLIVWGRNDQIFPADGAHPYKRDLKNLEFHLLDTGHFALEEDLHVIAPLMRRFLETRAPKGSSMTPKEP
jgi:pimeloyl-ACP methyl ester carboxylesterase